MNTLSSILFWAGVLLVSDGSLAILFQERWQKIAKEIDIQRIALVEIGVGFAALALHYLLPK